MKGLRWVQNLLIGAGMALLLLGGIGTAEACVEGLAWRMPLEQVETHLGRSQLLNQQQSGRYVAREVLLDRLPVSSATFDIDPEQGLKTLAYEFAIDDMTEVLAGLRARHGQPLSTSIKESRHNEQIWVWNTGEDLITAVKEDDAGQQKFLISYRPSRLRPEKL